MRNHCIERDKNVNHEISCNICLKEFTISMQNLCIEGKNNFKHFFAWNVCTGGIKDFSAKSVY